MKILFINYEYPPIGGGGGVGNKILADELAKKHEVDILTSGDKETSNYSREGKVKIFRVKSLLRESRQSSGVVPLVFFCISAFVKGFILARKNKYDVIHSFFALPSGLVGVALSKIFRIPHILTIVGGEIYDPTKSISPNNNLLTKLIIRNIINLSDEVTAISEDIKNRAEFLGYLKKEIVVVPLGFKPPQYKLFRKIDSKKFTLITIARLVKRKGIDYLLRALADIKDKKVKLVIIGEGPLKEELVTSASKLGISDRVQFAGYVEEKRKYELLSAADCFVSASLHEGLGLVFFEAMYCGLPIIATNVGGQTDFLENNRTGFLVTPCNPKKLARLVTIMKAKATLRKKFSINNKFAAKNYMVSKVSGRYIDTYKDILQSR